MARLTRGILRQLLLTFALALPAAADRPDVKWDTARPAPLCPRCDGDIAWDDYGCGNCGVGLTWTLPPVPDDPGLAARYLVLALHHTDTAFLAKLVEGDSRTALAALAILTGSRVSLVRPTAQGARVTFRDDKGELAVVLRHEKGKFLLDGREIHRPRRNEREVAALLRRIPAAQARLRDRDLDGNGQADFWCGDWSGLARLVLPNEEPAALIPLEAGAADLAPLPPSPQPRPCLVDPLPPAPWHGYRFRALRTTAAGRPFPTDGPDPDAHAWENPDHFAFVAIPASWGASGYQTFLVTEAGVWKRDLGPLPEETPPAEGDLAPAIGQALKDLDAEEAAVRDAAEARLAALGLAAAEELRKAAEKGSAEVKLRARGLLERISGARVEKGAWPGAGEDLESAGWERVE